MSTCIWRGAENPRTLPGRHVDACENETCKGCQPCTEPHCVVCGIEHKLGACPKCTGVARDDLFEIGRLCSKLGAEMKLTIKAPGEGPLANVPGGVLMFLDGPVANNEAWSHRITHALYSGQPHWRDELDSDGEPPLLMLTWWEEKWRDLTDNPTEDLASVHSAVTYLDEKLSWAADFEPHFEDFARDLRQQVARLEDALHEGVRVETGAPCMKCGANQSRIYAPDKGGPEKDIWRCPKCKQESSPGQYMLAVRQAYLANADTLTATDMLEQYRINVGTLQGWASKGHVAKRGRDDNGRRLYDVDDAVKMRDGREEDEAS